MANYVLLHGSWAGAWQWRQVATRLQDAGHQVFTPTFTGLGERVHLASPEIGLDTHIQDVVNVLRYEALENVILVGYSSSGVIASGVAEQVPGQIDQLIFLDALVIQDGQSIADIAGPDIMESLEAVAQEDGLGWQIPPDPSDETRHTPQPLKPLQQPLKISNPEAGALPRTFIYCKRGIEDIGMLHAPISRAAERLKQDDRWRYFEIDTGHMPMWSHPQELAELLINVA